MPAPNRLHFGTIIAGKLRENNNLRSALDPGSGAEEQQTAEDGEDAGKGEADHPRELVDLALQVRDPAVDLAFQLRDPAVDLAFQLRDPAVDLGFQLRDPAVELPSSCTILLSNLPSRSVILLSISAKSSREGRSSRACSAQASATVSACSWEKPAERSRLALSGSIIAVLQLDEDSAETATAPVSG
jgi:hypothetical protein